MYRNLYYVVAGCVLCLAVFFANFTSSARGRADFVWNNQTEPQTLDPGLMSGEPEGNISLGLHEGLTSFHPKSLEPMPGVAASWEINGLTYVFHLRPDAYWVKGPDIHTVDGKPRRVVAADFINGWMRHFFPETGSEYSYLLYLIEGAEEYEKVVSEHWKELNQRYAAEYPEIVVTGPRSLLPADREEVERFRREKWVEMVKVRSASDDGLEVTLKSPAPYFLAITSFYPMAPIPLEVIEKHGDLWTLPENIVTNGPFFLDDWRFNAYIRLRKNRHYWETAEYSAKRSAELKAKGALRDFERRELDLLETLGPFVANGVETADALAIEEENTALNLYLNGDCDRLRHLPTEVVGELVAAGRRTDNPLLHVHHDVVNIVYFYAVNMTLPAFAEGGEAGRKLRRALALAIDRRGLIDLVTRAEQIPAYRLVPNGLAGYSDVPLFGSGDYSRDAAEARRLLQEARAAGLAIPRLRVLYNTMDAHEKIAAFIQNCWKNELGLEAVDLMNQEWGVFLNTRRTQGFDVARAGWIGDYEDPKTFLELFFSTSQNNDPKYENPHYDRIVLEYAAKPLEYLDDGTKQQAMLADMRSWPAYAETVAKRQIDGGRLLDRALDEALAAVAAAKDDDKLDSVFAARLLLLQIAEEMLMHDMPVIPLYFYTQTELWPPELEGIEVNKRVTHPLKTLRWRGGSRPVGNRYADFPRLPTRRAAGAIPN